MRKYLIAGNWKMNKDHRETVDLINNIKSGFKPGDNFDALVCPPFTSIPAAVKSAEGSGIKVGGQNICWEEKGAYTGEISAQMLLTIGCEYVILGHSERREYLKESDELISKKVKLAIDTGIKPIVCVGETLDQREQNKTEEVIGGQFEGAFDGVDKVAFDQCVIAYEPVWAIGTGKTATPEMAEDVHRFIRNKVREKYEEDSAEKIRILYGGSMKPSNSAELLSQPDIDGGLIGGASLDAESFLGIISTVP